MKEFNVPLEDIFNGLSSEEKPVGDKVRVVECHNLVPLGYGYKLHETIIDMNYFVPESEDNIQTADIWKDHDDDFWADNDEDVWKDNPEL